MRFCYKEIWENAGLGNIFVSWRCEKDNKCSVHLSLRVFIGTSPIDFGPFYWNGLTLIPVWISNHIHYRLWDAITYPSSNFSGMDKDIHPTLYRVCWNKVTPCYTRRARFLRLGLSGLRGIDVVCVCPSLRPFVRKLYFVHTITRHRFELESPNLHQICILEYSQLVLKMEVIDLELQGHMTILS